MKHSIILPDEKIAVVTRDSYNADHLQIFRCEMPTQTLKSLSKEARCVKDSFFILSSVNSYIKTLGSHSRHQRMGVVAISVCTCTNV